MSNVTNMSATFSRAQEFNQPLDNWDVGNVTDMNYMFNYARLFNQDISGWNVDNVTNMSLMFNDAIAFNQDISGWNVDNVTNMNKMFNGATSFNQPLNYWIFNKEIDLTGFLSHATSYSDSNFSSLLVSLFKQRDTINPNVRIDASSNYYTTTEQIYNILITAPYNWIINANPTNIGYISYIIDFDSPECVII